MHLCLKTNTYRNGNRRTCRKCKCAYQRKYRKDGRYREYDKKIYEKFKNSNMHKAKTRIFILVRNGTLQAPKHLKCADCNRKAFCYDHRDYLKPIEVQPVCRSCNKKRGPGLNKL